MSSNGATLVALPVTFAELQVVIKRQFGDEAPENINLFRLKLSGRFEDLLALERISDELPPPPPRPIEEVKIKEPPPLPLFHHIGELRK